MGQIILCETIEAKNNYFLASINKEISTYEELCYYIREYFIFFVEEELPVGLLEWLRDEIEIIEIGQTWTEETTHKEKLYDIISCRNYFLPQEIGELLKKYDCYEKLSSQERKRKLADAYMKQKRYERALHYYKEANRFEENERVHYNIGVCYAHQWNFEEAALHFYRCYKMSNRKWALHAYYAALMLNGDSATVKLSAGNDYDSFIKNWELWEEEWQDKKREQDGKNNQYKKMKLSKWKKDYRKEVE